ncbi:MAG: hypothetical protein U1C58_06195 [Flavobacteriaceae bacterium]|nr:hypothetical protein [Flavobacteriaceae bacterium]MDZ4147855.1 hypothetical protein [Flavobacteriaceae bacterium]
MEQLTTYRAKGREIGLIFLFKYDLNGNLKAFELSEGELNPTQMRWLFAAGNFPCTEGMMQAIWMKERRYQKIFEIDRSVVNLSFDALWNLYGHKIKRHESELKFKKLKEADVIRCFKAVPAYKIYLARKGVAQTNLATFIHQRYFEDDWAKA